MPSLEDTQQEVAQLHEWVNDLLSGLHGYTIATLPVGRIGQMAYVTDATSPTFLGTLTDGGSTVVPVFFDGTNWVSV